MSTTDTRAAFTAWLEQEMPAGTVIGDPSWWATRIFRQLRLTEAAKATGTAGEIDADAEMANVMRDVELMGVGFLVDGKRCSLDRITWFNRLGDTWLPPPPGYPTEAARQPAPVVAVKTWQERMKTTTLTWKTGDGKLAAEFQLMADEIADLRAALAAANRSQPEKFTARAGEDIRHGQRCVLNHEGKLIEDRSQP